MFLVRSGKGSFDSPLEEHNRVIASPEDLRQLKMRLKEPILIDTDRAVAAPPAATSTRAAGAPDALAVNDYSLADVDKLYTGIVGSMKSLMGQVKQGGPLDLGKANDTVGMVAQLALRSPSYLKRVMRLKQFDEYTFSHSTNVCALAVMVGTSMGISRAEMYPLGLGALLHDVGKMKIPSAILNKPGKLTEEEFTVMRQHSLHGYALLRDVPSIHQDVPLLALNHHERIDGTGYPRALSDDSIDKLSSIVGICDMYDAMTSKRVYSAARSPFEAIRAIQTFSGASFPAELVDAFVGSMSIYPEGTWVQLSTGQVGVVVRSNLACQDKPVVKVVADRKWVCCRPVEIDLAAPHSVCGLVIAKVVGPDRLPMAARQ
jgi:HD-GYP domain-containing protein (c-di-GMP phosphodiesterase class II)